MAAGGDEIQVAADAGLGRVNVAEVVRAVDDPEFLVAGGEIENLLVIGKDDQRGEAELGADGNDVFLSRTSRRARYRSSRGRRQRDAETTATTASTAPNDSA